MKKSEIQDFQISRKFRPLSEKSENACKAFRFQTQDARAPASSCKKLPPGRINAALLRMVDLAGQKRRSAACVGVEYAV